MIALMQAQLDPTAQPILAWRDWLIANFPSYVSAPFAERHIRYWDWVTALRPGIRPRPRVEAWPRGGGKSTTIELSCAYLGAMPHPSRHFILYVSETQAQADAHIQSVARMLEHVHVRRAVNEYGASRGWRHQELRTASGFNVMAFGLDAGMRGIKLDAYRPDIIIGDDLDGRHDTAATVQKKIETLTETILPAGSTDVAVIIVQNLVHQHSIMSQLCDGRADFLNDREPPTVEPALRDFAYALRDGDDGHQPYVITAGEPTWAGQDRATCERQLNAWGAHAFRREAQQDVSEVEGALWTRAMIDAGRVKVVDVPRLRQVAVAIDPATTYGPDSDQTGLAVAGRGDDGEVYVLHVSGHRVSPNDWATRALDRYVIHEANEIVAESNQGGEMVRQMMLTAARDRGLTIAPRIRLIHASRGKDVRAEPVVTLYEQGHVHHVGLFVSAEDEMCVFPVSKGNDDQVDALVHAITAVMDAPPAAAPVGIAQQSRWH